MANTQTGTDYVVYKGSQSGNIVKASGHLNVGPAEALVQLTHSGVCGTDEHYLHAGVALGHEGIGIIKEIGSAVTAFKIGDRVGFGWVHYVCGQCTNCLSGLDTYCENIKFFGMADQEIGSFGSHVVWDVSTLHLIPEGLESEYAAPLMCGGATVWSVLSLYQVRPTDRVGVIGIGGLGHLAIQFAAKMGCEVVVFSGTESKRQEAINFGAKEFYATKGVTKFEGIKKINHLIITTSFLPDFDLYLPLMAADGAIFPLTISFDKLKIPALPLIAGGLRIQGSAVAPRGEIRKMLQFAVTHDVRPMIMTWPMNEKGVEDAMRTLREGKMRYRGVLVV